VPEQTVIDSLVIELGLNADNFDRNQQKAIAKLRRFEQEAQRQGKSVEVENKKIFDAVLGFKRGLVGAFGTFLVGRAAENFVNFITNLDASTGRLARTMGVSASELSAWQGALKQIGGNAESANSGLGNLNAEMVRFTMTGQSAMLPVLTRLGISLFDQNHHLITAGQLWIEAAAAVKRMGLDSRQAATFLAMIPGANQDLINFALLGPEAMRRYLAVQKQVSVTTRESSAAAKDYQRSLSLLDSAAIKLGRDLFTWTEPALARTNSRIRLLLEGFDALLSYWRHPTEKGNAELGSIANQLVTVIPGEQSLMNLFGIRPFREPMRAADAPGGSNADRFLAGLSYLETNRRNVGNATSSAQGYFQFTAGTARQAIAAGIPDPRIGSYKEQAEATLLFIRRFNPAAAAAIDSGDFNSAIKLLRGRWPSLPGGSQAQAPYRYRNFEHILANNPYAPPHPEASVAGAGPTGRPIRSSTSLAKSVTVNVGGVNIHAPRATDAAGIAKEITPALERNISAGAANYGPQ